MYAAVNNTRIYYNIIGKGRPLIMVHGNGEDHEIFDVAAGKLKEDYKVILIDSRGHGKSDKVKEYHYEDMAEDLYAFMRMLNLEDVIYYGFSDGGIIGLLLAMRTDRISRLIISGANVTPDGVKNGLKILIKLFYFFSRDPRMKMMLQEPDIRKEDLEKIGVKTTVIAGEKDAVKESETRFIAESIPSSKLMILPKEEHGTYIVHKTKIADIILKEIEEDQ